MRLCATHMLKIGDDNGVMNKQLALLDKLYARRNRVTIEKFGKRLYYQVMAASVISVVALYDGTQLPIILMTKQVATAAMDNL